MIDLNKARTALDQLGDNQEKTSKMHRFIQLLPSIEKARKNGIKHQAILDVLNAQGFALTHKSYSVMLSRAKQRKEKALIPKKPTIPSAITPQIQELSTRQSGLLQNIRDGIPDPPRFVWDVNDAKKIDW